MVEASQIANGKGATITVVDPNPSGSGIIPMEDLFIYVSLRIKPKSRSVLEVTNEGTDNSKESGIVLNLIGAKTDKTSGNEYMTTDWTNTGGPIGGRKNNETFGIKSISISYGADLLPVVNITFIDVKGASFFDGFEKTDTTGTKTNQSDFSSFFKIPYPIFELTVKGYYGKAVRYYLNMTKWTTSFSEGNFEIKANFLGYSTSFFSDILMDHVRAIVETDSGQNELKKVFKGKPVTTINEMLKNIGNVGKYLEDIKAKNYKKDDQGYGRLINLNETLSSLSNIRSIIGIPIQKLVSTDPKYYTLEGPYIGYDGLIARVNVFTFRDIMLIPNGPTLDTYNKFRDDIVSQIEKYDESMMFIGGNKFVDSYGISKAIGMEISEFLPKLKDGTENVKSVITSINKILVNGSNGRPIDKGYVDSQEFKKPPFDSFTGLTTTIKIDQKANMYDFYKIRDVVNQIYENLITERKTLADEVSVKINKEISKKIGFNPSVGDVFEILCNNVEAYINTIYTVSLNAETKNKDRVKIFTGFESDTNDERVFPWPMLYENGVETYIGNNKKVSAKEEVFPEVAFVEEIIAAQIKENDKANDIVIPLPNSKRSFPINPADLPNNLNPYPFDISNANPRVLSNLMSNIINRAVIAFDYSGLKETILDVASLEAAALFNGVVDTDDKNAINSFLENYKNDYFNLPIVRENLSFTKTGSTYYFGGTLDLNDNYKNISSTYIDSKTMFFDTSIATNSLTTSYLDQNNYELITNVKNALGERNISDVFKPNKDGIEFNTIYYGLEQNLTKMCWDDGVLNGKSYPETDKILGYIGNVKNGKSQLIYNLANSPSYVNYSSTTVTQIIGPGLYDNLPEDLFKGMMILSTYPFKGINKLVENLTDITKVVNVPLSYLAWIGAQMKRQKLFIKNNGVDLIASWFNYNNEFDVEQISSVNDYLWLSSKTKNKGILPTPFNDYNLFNSNINQVFIGVFNKWCELAKNCGLINHFNKPFSDTSQTELTKILNSIDYFYSNELIQLVSYTPNFWNLKKNSQFKIDEGILNNYLNVFSEKYSQLNSVITPTPPNYITPRKLDDKDIKLATYKTVKNLYDKWIGGTKDGEQAFNVGVNKGKTGNNPSLYSSFKFIDQDYNDISDTAKINLKSVLSILDNPNMNFLTLISKILTDNNFLLHKLPVYVDYSDIESVKDIFRTFTTINEINSGVSYIAMYGTGNSKLLDIPTGFEYGNDSYDFINGNTDSSALPNNLTMPAKEGKSKNLVAFRVAFGDENQSIFKNIRLSQEEMSDTAEYFKTLNDLVSNKGGTNRVLKGVDLYHLNSIRSYNVNMDMMGNAMIQPLMYLQLDNIPMFHGAYSVININHEITPNKMNTTIRAVRQSKYRTPIITESTTFVPLDLTKGLDLKANFKVASVVNIESDEISDESKNSYTPPVDGEIKINSGKGPRDNRQHNGVDIAANVGTPIKASWDGTIYKFLEGPNGTEGYGLYAIIDHSLDGRPFNDGFYYYTLYAHLSVCNSPNNTIVKSKQVIGLSGGERGKNNSGNSGGPHLHYEIRRSSNKLTNIGSGFLNLTGLNILDPEKFITKKDEKLVAGTPQHGQLGKEGGTQIA